MTDDPIPKALYVLSFNSQSCSQLNYEDFFGFLQDYPHKSVEHNRDYNVSQLNLYLAARNIFLAELRKRETCF